jgi:hypothetical protein
MSDQLAKCPICILPDGDTLVSFAMGVGIGSILAPRAGRSGLRPVVARLTATCCDKHRQALVDAIGVAGQRILDANSSENPS